jgi:hypothetical protein
LKNDENLRARRKSRSSAISFTTNTTWLLCIAIIDWQTVLSNLRE